MRGLGQWTAEMFLIFHLERPDVLSGGDLGIRKAMQIEYGLEEMPTPDSRCWRSASPGARTAASPRSTSGSRWRRCPGLRRGARASRLTDMRLADWHALRSVAASRLGRSPRRWSSTPTTRDDFQPLQRDEAVRAAHQAEAVAGALGRPAGQRRRLLPGRGRSSASTSSRSSAEPCSAGGAELEPPSSSACRSSERARLRTTPRRPDPRTGPGRTAQGARTRRDYFPITYAASRRAAPAPPSATTSAPTPTARRSCAAPATRGRPAATPLGAAADRRHRDQRLPAGLPRRRPDSRPSPSGAGP